MKSKPYLIILLLLLPSLSVFAESLYEQFPSAINSSDKYVFYSHGLIVEGDNETPVHPEYGTYEFPAIKQKLFEIGGFNLIAHHRPANTDVDEYVAQLSGWVEELLAAGVSAFNITLIGFSRGSHLTALASSRLGNAELNTVLMASCFGGDIMADPPVIIEGRLLSIFETTDQAGSCSKLAERSQSKAFEEVAITTGRRHGAFYLPLDDWLEPLANWLR